MLKDWNTWAVSLSEKVWVIWRWDEFSSFLISKNGIKVSLKKVEAMNNLPKPDSMTYLHRIIELFQLFLRFLLKFSELAAHYCLFKKDNELRWWDKCCDQISAKMETTTTETAILATPNQKKPLHGHVDASQTAVGWNLTQLDENDRDKVITFFFKKVSDAEVN